MSNLLRVKQLRSCPYITFKWLNFLNLFNHLLNITISILLLIELQINQPLYTFGYLATGLTGLTLAIISFRSAANLLSMGRTRRKWILKLLYLLQLCVFITHLAISISLWVNFSMLAQLLTQNTIDLLNELDLIKSIAIFLGFSSLLQGLIAYLCLYFRKFLGRQQITVVDSKQRLREMEMYQQAVQEVMLQMHPQEGKMVIKRKL